VPKGRRHKASDAWRRARTAEIREVNGRGERIRTSGPCLPKAVLSTVANVKSTTYAHRSRVYVTGMDWSRHI